MRDHGKRWESIYERPAKNAIACVRECREKSDVKTRCLSRQLIKSITIDHQDTTGQRCRRRQ